MPSLDLAGERTILQPLLDPLANASRGSCLARGGLGGRGSVSPREGVSSGKHAIHFLFIHDPKYLNDLEHLLERCTIKCSWFGVYAGIPFPRYSGIHTLRNLIPNGTLVPQFQLRLSFPKNTMPLARAQPGENTHLDSTQKHQCSQYCSHEKSNGVYKTQNRVLKGANIYM